MAVVGIVRQWSAMTYRLVLFDFDGVLADSAAWFTAQLPELADRHGFAAPDHAEIERLRKLSSREIMKAMKISPLKLPAIAADLHRRMADDAASIALFPQIPEMLSRLRDSGIRLAVVSSNSESNVRTVLGRHAGLVSAFSCGTSLFGKAARFSDVLRRLQIERAESCAVGDEVRDIEAAHRARIAAAAVAWGYGAPEALVAAVPDVLARSPAELAEFLIR